MVSSDCSDGIKVKVQKEDTETATNTPSPDTEKTKTNTNTDTDTKIDPNPSPNFETKTDQQITNGTDPPNLNTPLQDGSTETATVQNTKVKKNNKSDPIFWFAALPSPQLRSTQSHFSSAVQILILLATLVRELDLCESRIRDVRKGLQGQAFDVGITSAAETEIKMKMQTMVIATECEEEPKQKVERTRKEADINDQ